LVSFELSGPLTREIHPQDAGVTDHLITMPVENRKPFNVRSEIGIELTAPTRLKTMIAENAKFFMSTLLDLMWYASLRRAVRQRCLILQRAGGMRI
jgi:hypothetical protein